MKPSIILYKALPDDLLARLETHFTVTQVANLKPETVQQHAEAFANAQGLLGSSQTVDSALLEKMQQLRATSTISVGYDNFDVDALNARKIALMHTPTVLTETVADTIMALVLSSARRVVDVAERVKAGEWTKSIGPDWFGIDVHHKTMGIVGMGRIGLALAQRAHCGFGMPILYHARRQHAEAEERFQARHCDLETVLQESDFVCVVLPLTEETQHLIGKAQFAMMKKSAIFINAGRGPVVDEAALIEALQNGEIHAAGLDVFEQEPPADDNPLFSMENVIVSPHNAALSDGALRAMAMDSAQGITEYLTGKPVTYPVNKEVLK